MSIERETIDKLNLLFKMSGFDVTASYHANRRMPFYVHGTHRASFGRSFRTLPEMEEFVSKFIFEDQNPGV